MPFELGSLEVSAQEVARAKLADAQVLARAGLVERCGRPQLLPSDYVQSSAPRRQT